jgi:hypothetical protein
MKWHFSIINPAELRDILLTFEEKINYFLLFVLLILSPLKTDLLPDRIYKWEPKRNFFNQRNQKQEVDVVGKDN